jgi:hypothetical protein
VAGVLPIPLAHSMTPHGTAQAVLCILQIPHAIPLSFLAANGANPPCSVTLMELLALIVHF